MQRATHDVRSPPDVLTFRYRSDSVETLVYVLPPESFDAAVKVVKEIQQFGALHSVASERLSFEIKASVGNGQQRQIAISPQAWSVVLHTTLTRFEIIDIHVLPDGQAKVDGPPEYNEESKLAPTSDKDNKKSPPSSQSSEKGLAYRLGKFL